MQQVHGLLRRDGPRELYAIPTEIFLMIFDWILPVPHEMSTIEYGATFSALSLVCRLFRDECQPRLFRNLRFRGDPQTTRSEVFWSGLPETDEGRRILLLSCARECTFYWWSNSAILGRALCKAISCLHLSSLTLLRCSLSLSTLALLAEITNLRTLVLDGCELQPSELNIPTYIARPKWISISVLSACNGEIHPWFISGLLQLVDIKHLELFSSDHTRLALPFFRGRCVPRLHTFRLGGWGGRMSDLYTILEAMPNVTTLLIPSRNWTPLYPPPVRIAPRLRNITARPHIAMQLVPCRPVACLELLHCDFHCDCTWPNACFQDFQGSTTGLREVTIPSHVLPSIRRGDLPFVKVLALRPIWGEREHTIHFMDHFETAPQTSLPSVDVLKYVIEHAVYFKQASRLLNLRVQLSKLVKKIVTLFPNVIRVQVGQTVEWSRETPSSEHWTPRIVSRPLVRELLLRPDVRNVDDVDGCLLSALWKKDLTPVARVRLGESFKAE